MPVAIPCGHSSVSELPDDIFKSPAADQPGAGLAVAWPSLAEPFQPLRGSLRHQHQWLIDEPHAHPLGAEPPQALVGSGGGWRLEIPQAQPPAPAAPITIKLSSDNLPDPHLLVLIPCQAMVLYLVMMASLRMATHSTDGLFRHPFDHSAPET